MILVVRDLPSVQMQEQKWILLCVCCIWLMCLIMYFIVQQMSKDNQTKLEYELMKEKEKYSKESMEIIKRSNEELREFKHDLKKLSFTSARGNGDHAAVGNGKGMGKN